MSITGVPRGSMVKNLPVNAGNTGDPGSMPGLGRYPGVETATHSRILAWKISWTEERSLAGYSPWGHKESNTTERLSAQHTHNYNYLSVG